MFSQSLVGPYIPAKHMLSEKDLEKILKTQNKIHHNVRPFRVAIVAENNVEQLKHDKNSQAATNIKTYAFFYAHLQTQHMNKCTHTLTYECVCT